jgi:hypothetical protein
MCSDNCIDECQSKAVSTRPSTLGVTFEEMLNQLDREPWSVVLDRERY